MRCVIHHNWYAGGLIEDLQEVDELVDEWTPEPLIAPQTSFEEAENEKTPVIVG